VGSLEYGFLTLLSRVAPTTPLPVFQRCQRMSLAGGWKHVRPGQDIRYADSTRPAGRSERERERARASLAMLATLLRPRYY
jgi:hypothetical protein